MGKKYENPLLPHARIRDIFKAMLDARTFAVAQSKATRPNETMSECAIAVAAGLRDAENCNVSAPNPALHPYLSLALGLPLRQVSRGARTPKLQESLQAQPLEQLYLALGAAAASKTPALLLAEADRLNAKQWSNLLADAARLNAPTILVAFPGRRTGLARLAEKAGVPGIPVDAADPIALYRVAGESFGRALAGGGPALIDAVTLPGSSDALKLLRGQMIKRGAATERWAVAREGAPPTKTASPRSRPRPEKVH